MAVKKELSEFERELIHAFVYGENVGNPRKTMLALKPDSTHEDLEKNPLYNVKVKKLIKIEQDRRDENPEYPYQEEGLTYHDWLFINEYVYGKQAGSARGSLALAHPLIPKPNLCQTSQRLVAKPLVRRIVKQERDKLLAEGFLSKTETLDLVQQAINETFVDKDWNNLDKLVKTYSKMLGFDAPTVINTNVQTQSVIKVDVKAVKAAREKILGDF